MNFSPQKYLLLQDDSFLWIVYIGVVFKVITLATATHDSHYCTFLGHLGCCNRDRIISISVALPKVAKSSTSVSQSHVIVAGIVALSLPM
jgi:hypothetical protein